MVRIILAVIIGFLVWSILWVGSEQVLSMIFPNWYGAHQIAFEKAVTNNTPFFIDDTALLIWNVVRGIIVSIISGYIAALIAGENKTSTLVLGVCLLLFGLYIVYMTWAMIPVWYHAVFSLMLIPMTILGGRLKSFSAATAS
jgi:hypothetical protein